MFQGVITFTEKENCPFLKRRPHWVYFNSLPRLETLDERSIIVDSCSDVHSLVEMRKVLKEPTMTFIVSLHSHRIN